MELKAREELVRARAVVTPEAEVIGILVQDTPPRPGGEFQGGPSVSVRGADGGEGLVCRLNLWRMELFKYTNICQAVMAHVGTLSLPRCRH